MKCPTCHEPKMGLLHVTPPATHLMGGMDILWCENCGTTATTFYPSESAKLHDLQVPRMFRSVGAMEVKDDEATKRRKAKECE